MSSRDTILKRIQACEMAAVALPELSRFGGSYENLKEQFIDAFNKGGGSALVTSDIKGVEAFIRANYGISKRIVANVDGLPEFSETLNPDGLPHTYNNTEAAILYGHFAVAENGAIWITDDLMVQRIIPFICQHLFVIIHENQIVPTMHEAYKEISSTDYGYGCFISGPSKSADIEQALVLGAHGPLSMTVFILS